MGVRKRSTFRPRGAGLALCPYSARAMMQLFGVSQRRGL